MNQEQKRAFGKELQRRLVEKGWNQSVLARRAGIGRDAVSTYIRGVSFPEPHNLRKITDALELEPGALIPESGNSLQPSVPNAFELKQVDEHGERFLVSFRRVVSHQGAQAILRVLAEEARDHQSPAT